MENLHSLRKQKGMSQLSIATRVGIGQESISAYEKGKSYPSVKALLKLCEELGVSSDFLLDRTSVRTPVEHMRADKLSAAEQEFVMLLRSLPPSKRERAIGIMLGLLENENKEAP